MMRVGLRLFTSLALLALATAPLSAQAAPAGRVAYVAVQAILRETPGYAQAESSFAREMDGARVEVQRLRDSLNTAAQKFEESSVMLSASNRAAERKKLEDLQVSMERRMAELQQQMGVRRQELMDPIEERVMAIIEGLRAEGNYGIILDISNQYSQVVSADKALDLTPKVIERLKAQAAPAAGAATPPRRP
jgi:outer membrane protein